ncbi:MAG: hypothetical protein ACTSRP_12280 [Candidatus Helarchaeota archaeon]
MNKFDLELLGSELLEELKEIVNNLEESFNGGAFQESIEKVSNVFYLLKNMKCIIVKLRIYQEFYELGS